MIYNKEKKKENFKATHPFYRRSYIENKDKFKSIKNEMKINKLKIYAIKVLY